MYPTLRNGILWKKRQSFNEISTSSAILVTPSAMCRVIYLLRVLLSSCICITFTQISQYTHIHK